MERKLEELLWQNIHHSIVDQCIPAQDSTLLGRRQAFFPKDYQGQTQVGLLIRLRSQFQQHTLQSLEIWAWLPRYHLYPTKKPILLPSQPHSLITVWKCTLQSHSNAENTKNEGKYMNVNAMVYLNFKAALISLSQALLEGQNLCSVVAATTGALHSK